MASATAAAVSAPKAGFWIRVLAYLIDVVILLLVQLALGIIARDSAGVLSFLVGIAYFVYFWSSYGNGRTVGMRALGLKVVRVDGSELTPVNALVRYVGLLVAAIPFGIGLIWVAFDGEKQGWHDKIAGTYVLKSA